MTVVTSGQLAAIAEALALLETGSGLLAEDMSGVHGGATTAWQALQQSWDGPFPNQIDGAVDGFLGAVASAGGHGLSISSAIGRLKVMANACALTLARAERVVADVDALPVADPDEAIRRRQAAWGQINDACATWGRSCRNFSLEVEASLTALSTVAEAEIAGLPYDRGELSGMRYLVAVSVFGETEGFAISFIDPTGQTQAAISTAIGETFSGPNGESLYTMLETSSEQWGVEQADGQTESDDLHAAGNFNHNLASAIAMGRFAGLPFTDDEAAILAAQLTALSWLLRADETDAWEQLDGKVDHPEPFDEAMTERALDNFTDADLPFMVTGVLPDAPELPADATPEEIAIHRLIYGPHAPGPITGDWGDAWDDTVHYGEVAWTMFVPDPSAVFGEDATLLGAALEVAGVVPIGAIAKLGTVADAFDAARDIDRIVDAGVDGTHIVDDLVEAGFDPDALLGLDDADALTAADDVDEIGTGADIDTADELADRPRESDGDSSDDTDVGESADSSDGGTTSEPPPFDDPDGRLRPAEVNTGHLLLELPEYDGRTLVAHPDQRYDFVTDLGENIDAMGAPGAYEYWNERRFLASIDEHLLKQNCTVAIDVTWSGAEHIDTIVEYVNSLPAASQARIIIVGG